VEATVTDHCDDWLAKFVMCGVHHVDRLALNSTVHRDNDPNEEPRISDVPVDAPQVLGDRVAVL
jgi:hypothetical protein